MKPAVNQSRRRRQYLLLIGLGIVLVAALALRATELSVKSFWLDELHTLDIASADNISGVVDRLRPDFHAPAYFSIIHLLDMESPETGRWVSIAAGLLTLLLGVQLSRESGFCVAGQLGTAVAFAALPFQIQYTVELRPYAMLQLCTLLAAWGAFSHRRSDRFRLIIFIVAATLGLYSHYLMSVVIVSIGAAHLATNPSKGLPLKKVLLGGTIAVIAFLPWVVMVEDWIFTDPGVMVRDEEHTEEPEVPRVRKRIDIVEMAALPARLISPLGRSLGGSGGVLVLGLSSMLAVLGGFTLLTRGIGGVRAAEAEGRLLSSLIVVAVSNGVLTLTGCVWIWGRLPTQYFIGTAWIWPFLIGGILQFEWIRNRSVAVLAALVVTCATLGMIHVNGNPRENLREGVAATLKLASEKNAVYTAVLSQPDHYDSLMPFRIYAPDSTPLSHADAKRLSDRPVVVLTRSLRGSLHERRAIVSHYIGGKRTLLARTAIDRSITVLLFSPASP